MVLMNSAGRRCRIPVSIFAGSEATDVNPTEKCWQTGAYSDDCECEFRAHKHECSGYDGEDD